MSLARTMLPACPTFSEEASPFSLGRALLRSRPRTPVGPRLRARQSELQLGSLSRLSYFSNEADFVNVRARPLLLVHDVHVAAGAHELSALFEALREERLCYVLDLPGFGESEGSERDLGPELYVAALRGMLEHITKHRGAADVIAVGLAAEFAAHAAIAAPSAVRSLTLVSPTGFAVRKEQDAFERASRQGRATLPIKVASKLGVAPLLCTLLAVREAWRRNVQQGEPRTSVRVGTWGRRYARHGAAERAGLAYLAGALHPRGNPQSAYTRVHCPALILFSDQPKPRYGSLPTFVKWHEYFVAEKLDDASLAPGQSVSAVVNALRTFWERVRAHELASDEPLARSASADPDDAIEVAAVSSY